MPKLKKIKQGFALHCHHNILVEYCYDYDYRVYDIKKDKPQNEQETRLRLFKILPPKVLKDIPKEYQEADQKWPQESKDAFHKKWCGCSEWNGKEIVFP